MFAGFHYDLNFMTIHGRSRYPGLFAWLADGRRIAVSTSCMHWLRQLLPLCTAAGLPSCLLVVLPCPPSCCTLTACPALLIRQLPL